MLAPRLPMPSPSRAAYCTHLAECPKCRSAALGPATRMDADKCPAGLALWRTWHDAKPRVYR